MKASTIITAVTSATAALTFGAMPAAADIADRFERRIDRQADRIAQGVRSGELTAYEARSLKRQNRRIKRTFDRFCRDSHLSPYEIKRMRKLLSAANDNIYAEKHDDDRRYARNDRRHDRYSDNRFNNGPWYNYRRYMRRWW